MENLVADILKILQLLIIPIVIFLYRYFKRQTIMQRDIEDLKCYVGKICEKMDVICTLRDGKV